MAKAKFNPGDDRFTRGLIRHKAKQIVGRAGSIKEDQEDIEQDLFVRVLQSLPHFNPEKGHYRTFVTTVVERHVANILRNKRAEKRDHRGITSLNVMIEITAEGPTELAQTIGERELDARFGRNRRSENEVQQLALDLADIIATLPESWRTLLELRKSHTITEAAGEMGVSRTTLYDWMRRIRRRFENAGMRSYLK